MAMPMDVQIQQGVVDYIQVSGVLMEKAAEQQAKIAAEKKSCAALIPAAVEELIAHQCIPPHQKEAATRMLSDHATALKILKKVAQLCNTAEQGPIGYPVNPNGQTKKAGARQKPMTSFEKATQAMLPHLGLA